MAYSHCDFPKPFVSPYMDMDAPPVPEPSFATDRIRIAIIGGGIAGVVLLKALTHYPHLDPHLYEAKSQFGSEKASLNLGVHQLRALDMMMAMGPFELQFWTELQIALKRNACVKHEKVSYIVGSGPDAGKVIFEDSPSSSTSTCVDPDAFVNGLLSRVCSSYQHTERKLVSIAPAGSTPEFGPLQRLFSLHFADGTEEFAHVIIGADGVFSVVRPYMLGESDVASRPFLAGWRTYRSVVPHKMAIEKLGTSFFPKGESRTLTFLGERALATLYLSHDTATVECSATVEFDGTELTNSDPSGTYARNELETTFKRWGDHGTIAREIVELLLYRTMTIEDSFQQIETKYHAQAGDRICLIGSAAHAMTPWLCADDDMAIEDALILSNLIGSAHTANGIDAALRAYAEVRTTRTKHVMRLNTNTGAMMCGRGFWKGPVGLDLQRLREAMESRWQTVHRFDMREHLEHAFEVFYEVGGE